MSSPHPSPIPAWKRLIDILFCVALLPILALATLVMTVLVRLTAPGPVFFRQERVGYMGRRFRLYKFRTMKVGADTSMHQAHVAQLMAAGVPMLKLDRGGDSRLIPLGWLLRATGLDELPQIINVLRGEMSVVGPRPCIPYEYERYLPWQRKRFLAMPGLTGLWQVSGKNRTTFDEMVRLDIRYSEEKSLPLDLKIMILTVPALVIQVVDARLRAKPAGAAAAPHGDPQPLYGSKLTSKL